MKPDEEASADAVNWTMIALLGGLVLLVLVIAFFATRGGSNQDKLTNVSTQSSASPSRDKVCASKATYDFIKRELFRRAAELRGSDQAAYDRVSAYAVVRMENPVMENEDSSTGAVHCSGSLSIDLPPGVAVTGGRRTLTSDVDYSIQQAADGSGSVLLLENADSIITPLATLGGVSQPAPEPTPPVEQNEIAPEAPDGTEARSSSAPQPRTSFSCADPRTHGEIAVCGDTGLAALDRQMAAQYGQAIAGASPGQRAILQRTQDRFFGYRDRCPDNPCIGDAYIGRMREIRDIMEGRWQPPR